MISATWPHTSTGLKEKKNKKELRVPPATATPMSRLLLPSLFSISRKQVKTKLISLSLSSFVYVFVYVYVHVYL